MLVLYDGMRGRRRRVDIPVTVLHTRLRQDRRNSDAIEHRVPVQGVIPVDLTGMCSLIA